MTHRKPIPIRRRTLFASSISPHPLHTPLPLLPRIHLHTDRRRRQPRRRQTRIIRERSGPVEATRREQIIIVGHGGRVHVERHEPRGAGVAPVARVGAAGGAGHGVESPVAAGVGAHVADAFAAAEERVGVVRGEVLLRDGGGVGVAAGVGGEDHLPIELGHDAVLLVHEEGVGGLLEAGGEGGGVLADAEGLGVVVLLVEGVVWQLLDLLLLLLLLLHL